jgi:glucosamine--fructose-6-phosphate aminotransferase (isomerizing)
MIESNPYIADILAQPAALRAAVQHYPHDAIQALGARLQAGEFSRIVMTGMGSSYNAAYPAFLKLTKLAVPVTLVNTAELLNYSPGQVDARSLLWMSSQSGRSAEIVRLLEQVAPQPPACVLSMTNFGDSPLGQQADVMVPIWAGEEATVSTKTYLNMLALLMLASEQMTGGDWLALQNSILRAADTMEAYLAGWQEHITELDALLERVDQLFILGRGPSMGAVWNGSLINKEAAKCAFEGMNAADFRHGPLELAGPQLTVLIFEGAPRTAALNRALALEVKALGGQAIWLAMQTDPDLPTLRLPLVDESVRPLVEILPLQLLTIVMARRNGFVPGKFRHIAKITTQE